MRRGRVVLPEITEDHPGVAQSVRARCRDLDPGLADAVNVALAADYDTDAVLTLDRREGGAAIALHAHNRPESVTVLEGDAVVEIDGTEHHVTRFDATYVPAGVPHRFRNASATEPMRILSIYASADVTRTLVGTGVTARVDAEHVKAA
ncbi:cupin domain-containing protein [Streptomyces sp. NRRL F-3307]|uniref:cupin domain-containing protein n=1 Tax=Streptomyces TaxID=1883 RepID=UPI000A786B74|nr:MULTISPECIES: cupin domain-containing protein [Streptomyces]